MRRQPVDNWRWHLFGSAAVLAIPVGFLYVAAKSLLSPWPSIEYGVLLCVGPGTALIAVAVAFGWLPVYSKLRVPVVIWFSTVAVFVLYHLGQSLRYPFAREMETTDFLVAVFLGLWSAAMWRFDRIFDDKSV